MQLTLSDKEESNEIKDGSKISRDLDNPYSSLAMVIESLGDAMTRALKQAHAERDPYMRFHYDGVVEGLKIAMEAPHNMVKQFHEEVERRRNEL